MTEKKSDYKAKYADFHAKPVQVAARAEKNASMWEKVAIEKLQPIITVKALNEGVSLPFGINRFALAILGNSKIVAQKHPITVWML